MANRTIRTPKNRDRFIEALREERSVTYACNKIMIGRTAAYAWRNEDESFKAAWDEAIEQNVDDLEASMMKKAIEGWDEPVWWQGEQCGEVRKFSTPLSIFMLKANRPEKYHLEKKEAAVASGKSTGVLVAPETKTPDQWISEQKATKASDAGNEDDNAES